MPHHDRIDRVVGQRRLAGHFALGLGIDKGQFRVDRGDVALQLVELRAKRAEMVEQQAALGRGLRAVAAAELLGEVVELLHPRPHVGLVLLVLLLEHFAAGESLRPLLRDHVAEIGLCHGVDDLRHIVRVRATELHLHHFGRARGDGLQIAAEPIDRVWFLCERGKLGDAWPPQGRGEHERTLDQLQLRLPVLVVVGRAGPDERARVGPHPQPGHGLVAPWQEQPGRDGGRHTQRQAQCGRRQPPPPDGMPHPHEVQAAPQLVSAGAVGHQRLVLRRQRERGVSDGREHPRRRCGRLGRGATRGVVRFAHVSSRDPLPGRTDALNPCD